MTANAQKPAKKAKTIMLCTFRLQLGILVKISPPEGWNSAAFPGFGRSESPVNLTEPTVASCRCVPDRFLGRDWANVAEKRRRRETQHTLLCFITPFLRVPRGDPTQGRGLGARWPPRSPAASPQRSESSPWLLSPHLLHLSTVTKRRFNSARQRGKTPGVAPH